MFVGMYVYVCWYVCVCMLCIYGTVLTAVCNALTALKFSVVEIEVVNSIITPSPFNPHPPSFIHQFTPVPATYHYIITSYTTSFSP